MRRFEVYPNQQATMAATEAGAPPRAAVLAEIGSLIRSRWRDAVEMAPRLRKTSDVWGIGVLYCPARAPALFMAGLACFVAAAGWRK